MNCGCGEFQHWKHGYHNDLMRMTSSVLCVDWVKIWIAYNFWDMRYEKKILSKLESKSFIEGKLKD